LRIELEEPFKSKWLRGYKRISIKDGRARIDLINSSKERTTISYARYLLSIKIGRELLESEEADHINGDRTNDDINNLQVLNKEVHLEKTLLERENRLYYRLRCPQCRKEFQTPANQVRNGKKLKFCSRSCNGKFSTIRNTKWVYGDEEILELIATEQVLEVFRTKK